MFRIVIVSCIAIILVFSIFQVATASGPICFAMATQKTSTVSVL